MYPAIDVSFPQRRRLRSQVYPIFLGNKSLGPDARILFLVLDAAKWLLLGCLTHKPIEARLQYTCSLGRLNRHGHGDRLTPEPRSDGMHSRRHVHELDFLTLLPGLWHLDLVSNR